MPPTPRALTTSCGPRREPGANGMGALLETFDDEEVGESLKVSVCVRAAVWRNSQTTKTDAAGPVRRRYFLPDLAATGCDIYPDHSSGNLAKRKCVDEAAVTRPPCWQLASAQTGQSA